MTHRPTIVSAGFMAVGIFCAGYEWSIPFLFLISLIWFFIFYYRVFSSNHKKLNKQINDVAAADFISGTQLTQPKHIKAKHIQWLILPVLFLFLGFLRQEWAYHQMNTVFYDWQDQTVTVQGYLVTPPVMKNCYVQYTICAETIVNAENVKTEFVQKKRIQANDYDSDHVLQLSYGQNVRVKGKLKIPNGKRNPGGFNMAYYLAARDIYAQVTLSTPPDIVEGNQGNVAFSIGFDLKEKAMIQLNHWLGETEAAVMAGILLGETDSLEPETKNAFRSVGLSHVMAVSGANIAFLLFPLLWLLKRAGVNKKWSSVAALPLLALYVLMTGFEASIVRAAFVAFLMLVGSMIWRKSDWIVSLSLAFLLMLSLNSLWLFDAGFQLSFLAVTSIGLLYEPIAEKIPKKIPEILRNTFAGTLSAQIGVLPVLAGTFHVLATLSIPANLVVVPATGLITLLGAILLLTGSAVPLIGVMLGSILSWLLSILMSFIYFSASIPGSEYHVANPPFIMVMLYIAWIIYFRFGFIWFDHDRRKRINIKAVLVSVILLVIILIPDNKCHITVADVGQGDGILIVTPSGKSIIVDAGGSASDVAGSRSAEQVMLPLLAASGSVKPDILISTHPHSDHILGIIGLAELVGSNEIVLSERHLYESNAKRLIDVANKKNISVRSVQFGDIIYEESGFFIKVLSPLPDWTPKNDEDNETSLVLLLSYKDFSMIFSADAGEEAEKIMEDNALLFPVDVLKIGHHGSNSSTSEAFLQKVKPKIAAISVGKNLYGHPSPKVLRRLENIGTSVHTTIESGAFILETNGKSMNWYPYYSIKKSIFD